MDYAIRDIIEPNEEKYVEFFNTVGPLSTRLHKLELIPELGKSTCGQLLKQEK